MKGLVCWSGAFHMAFLWSSHVWLSYNAVIVRVCMIRISFLLAFLPLSSLSTLLQFCLSCIMSHSFLYQCLAAWVIGRMILAQIENCEHMRQHCCLQPFFPFSFEWSSIAFRFLALQSEGMRQGSGKFVPYVIFSSRLVRTCRGILPDVSTEIIARRAVDARRCWAATCRKTFRCGFIFSFSVFFDLIWSIFVLKTTRLSWKIKGHTALLNCHSSCRGFVAERRDEFPWYWSKEFGRSWWSAVEDIWYKLEVAFFPFSCCMYCSMTCRHLSFLLTGEYSKSSMPWKPWRTAGGLWKWFD